MSESAPGFLLGGGELGALIRAKDWSQTPLGEPSGWPQSLRTSVSICLASRFPLFLWWGPGMVTIYNDAYIPVFAEKHPWALGEASWEVWREVWDIVGPLAMGVMERGEATWESDLLLVLERHGYPEECYFDFAYSPIVDETGGVGGLFSVVSETTKRVLSERRLLTLSTIATQAGAVEGVEAVARASVEALAIDRADLPFAILFEQDGKTRRLVAATGLTAAQQKRMSADPSLLDVSAPEQIALDAPEDRPAADKTLIVQIDDATTGPVARGLLFGVSKTRPLDEDLEGFCGLAAAAIGTAIADAHALEEQRARTQALAELDRAKTEFFSNVSHEFRTPLSLMLGPLESAIARRDADPQLVMAHRNALRLLRHVNSLLDFARLQDGRATAARQPVDLSGLTAELASVFRSAIEQAGLALDVQCPPLSRPVMVDPGQWEQIVLNLLSNAVKFTFEGTIGVAVSEDDGRASVAISDSGVGISDSEVARLFERFYRVSGARSRSHEGSGIGLSLTKALVELHDGTIAVQSREGSGTTVRISLPLAHDAVSTTRVELTGQADAYVSEAVRWSDTVAGPSELLASTATRGSELDGADHFGEAGGQHVLIVDDNADMRDYLQSLLEGRYVVSTATQGLEAMALLREHGADLVISDVMMPELDGFGLIAELRADEALAGIPVLLLSARAGEDASVLGLGAGADDYIAKPFSSRELLARVSSNLTLGAMRNQEARRAAEHAESLERLLALERRTTETLQQSLLPRTLDVDPFTAVTGRYVPAADALLVGGDFYDAIDVNDGRLLLLIGDVAGHGVEAAALMGHLRAAAVGFALSDPAPASVLRGLNALSRRLSPDAMTTCLCVLLDADGCHVTCASAGHFAPLIHRAGAEPAELSAPLGLPLGVGEQGIYSEARSAVQTGDLLVLYTDGLVERRGESIDEGRLRLRRRLSALATRDPDTIADTLLAQESAERSMSDDVALLIADLARPSASISLEFPALADRLARLRSALRRWLAAQSLSDQDAEDLLLAGHEAAANVVMHAYRHQDGLLRFSARRDEFGVHVEVRDRGRWDDRPNGRGAGYGLGLIDSLMSHVEVHRGPPETVVRMSKLLG